MSLSLQVLKSQISSESYLEIPLGQDLGFVFTLSKLQYGDQKTAFFGGWTWLDEKQNMQFINTASQWAKSQNCTELIGPYDYSSYFSYRLRIDHFENIPFSGEPRNHQSDIHLLEKLGFSILQKYETIHFHSLDQLLELSKVHFHKLHVSLREKGLEVTTTNLKEISSQIKDFYNLSHEIFQDNFLYNGIPEAAFEKYFNLALAPSICWQTTTVLRRLSDNKIVGYSLNFRESSQPHKLFIKSAGVIPHYRFMGLSFLALCLTSVENSRGIYSEVAFCLMREGNFPSLMAKKLIADKQSYALFIKNLI